MSAHCVAVVGHGLIGGSIALAIRERMPGVGVVTIDRGGDLIAAASSDLVVLAAPVLANLDILQRLRDFIAPQAIVTDTGSTKHEIVRAGAGVRFVGGHPIAGAAAGGREAADADLFVGRTWILTPTRDSAVEDVARVRRFVQALGAAPVMMDADEHDRVFAFVSHLPQVAVSALMDAVGTCVGVEGLAHAGSGLRDSTRLAASPPEIWRDIVATNRTNVNAALDALIERLQQLRDDETGDALARVFAGAARWKRALDDR